MNTSFRRMTFLGLIAALMMMLTLPALAQDGEITLEPYDNQAFNITGLRPAGWTEAGPGVFARGASPQDITLFMQQSLPRGAVESIQANLRPGLMLQEWPEPVDMLETETFDWHLYIIEVAVPGMTVVVDVALAQDETGAYLVLVQSTPEDHEMLREEVFLPAVEALTHFTGEVVDLDADLPYVVEYVTFENTDADGETFTLAGTLTMPDTEGPHPAVILISGSGPSDRDETLEPIASIRPFRLISDYLTREGIAVLRYDDRGVGESGGDHASAHSGDLATDTDAAVRYLLTREEINPEQIGLLGHSEGGLIAAIVTARNEDVAFMISMAGSAVRGADILILQNELVMRSSGMDEETIAEQMADVVRFYELMVAGDIEAIDALLEEMGLADGPRPDQDVWFNYFVLYDPTPDLEQITVPVLALFGGLDVQVDADQNATALQAALEVAGNEDYTIVVFPEANHLFQAAVTGSPDEYGTLEQEFVPEFLPTIIDWLRERVDIQSS